MRLDDLRSTSVPVVSNEYLMAQGSQFCDMMTSPNGSIFRVTGPLCGEFTGPGEFPAQRPVTRSFDVFFDLRPNKRLSKQPRGWWFKTPSWSLWRHCNEENHSRCKLSQSLRDPYLRTQFQLIFELILLVSTKGNGIKSLKGCINIFPMYQLSFVWDICLVNKWFSLGNMKLMFDSFDRKCSLSFPQHTNIMHNRMPSCDLKLSHGTVVTDFLEPLQFFGVSHFSQINDCKTLYGSSKTREKY